VLWSSVCLYAGGGWVKLGVQYNKTEMLTTIFRPAIPRLRHATGAGKQKLFTQEGEQDADYVSLSAL
jgi:hypothetical protein